MLYSRQRTFPWKPTDNGILIPGSDGAGDVLAIGSNVKNFKSIVVYYPNLHHSNASTIPSLKRACRRSPRNIPLPQHLQRKRPYLHALYPSLRACHGAPLLCPNRVEHYTDSPR